ncbi:cell wall elongation regulator TseB-like domain-containing protein [Bacillus sp. FJAT-45350]|uniref:cell wall elongation regulator TseB-like domain-containing protein n=1 Tax=Bacillus sp. FJAT-45350 TaxID=2011014 RepID=UPI000BB856B7|nr:DUF5590 domain-containing protein [Bacillus sp. FJAT-45350]
MKKWFILGSLILLLAIIGLTSYFYIIVRAPLVESQEELVQFAHENTEISIVNDVKHYFGSDAYTVIFGMNEEEENIIVWIREDREKIVTKKVDDGWSKEQVIQFANEQLPLDKLVSIRLGVERELPVYEIAYIDNEDRYAYHYITFDNGTFVKRYSLRRQ